MILLIIKRTALIICAFALASHASAGMLIETNVVGLQPQIGRDQSGYNTCGIRAMVMAEHSGFIHTYDFSINIQHNLYFGFLKSGKSRTTKKESLAKKSIGTTHLPAPTGFWISKEKEGKPLVMQKLIAAETKGFVLGYGDFEQSLDMIYNLIGGEKLHFVMRYPTEKTDAVISFNAVLTEPQSESLLSCIQGLLERMLSETEAKQ
jgi:hypothetical protein